MAILKIKQVFVEKSERGVPEFFGVSEEAVVYKWSYKVGKWEIYQRKELINPEIYDKEI